MARSRLVTKGERRADKNRRRARRKREKGWEPRGLHAAIVAAERKVIER